MPHALSPRLPSLDPKQVVSSYILDSLGEDTRRVLTGFYENVEKGLLDLVVEPEPLAKLLEKIGDTVPSATVWSSMLREDRSPGEILQVIDELYDPIAVAYLYARGMDISDPREIRRTARRIAEEFEHVYGDKIEMNELSRFKSFLRSRNLLVKVIPALADAMLMLEEPVMETFKSVEPSDVHEFAFWFTRQAKPWHRRTAGFLPVPVKTLAKKITPYVEVYHVFKDAIENPEKMKRLVSKHLHIEPEMDGVKLDYDRGRIKIYYGDRLLDILELDVKQFMKTVSGEDWIRQALLQVVGDNLEQILMRHSLHLYTGRDETLLVRYGEEGMKILYPPNRRYVPYYDIRRILDAVADKGILYRVLHDFKEHAIQHGIVYPQDHPIVERVIASNKVLGVKVFETVYGSILAESRGHTVFSDSVGKALYQLAVFMASNREFMPAKRMLNWALGLEVVKRDAEWYPRLERLHKVVDIMQIMRTYMSEYRDVFISDEAVVSDSLDAVKNYLGLKSIRTLISGEKFYVVYKVMYPEDYAEISGKYGFKMEGDVVMIPLEKYTMKLARELGFLPDEGAVMLKSSDHKVYYPFRAFTLLKRAEETLVADDGRAIIVKYKNMYIAIPFLIMWP